MVGMAFSFSQPQFSTPHGGAPFHGWKKGHGFGKALGPGGYMDDKSVPKQLVATPSQDRGFASSPFWRVKTEIGQAAGFGIGDRPTYIPKDSVAPDNYGDVSKRLMYTRRNSVRPGITIKAKFPGNEERYRELNVATAGPGPAKYYTCSKTGQSSLCTPVKCSSFSMGGRPMGGGPDFRNAMAMPGPGEYNIRGEAGKNSPILRGTIADITIKPKREQKDGGCVSPGPARYFIKGNLDKYTLGTMIANAQVPKEEIPEMFTKSALAHSSSEPALHTQDADAVDKLMGQSA